MTYRMKSSAARRTHRAALTPAALAIDAPGIGGVRRSSGTQPGSPAAPVVEAAGSGRVLRDASQVPSFRIAGTTRVHEDRSAFLAAVGWYALANGFDALANGASGERRHAGDGFAHAVDTEFRGDGLLYNGDGFVSTDSASQPIAMLPRPSGRAITAVGRDLRPSDLLSLQSQ